MLVTLFGMVVVLQPFINVFVAVSIIQLLPFPELYAVFPSSTSILVNLLQERNALSPMLVTLFPIVILVNQVQEENADSPMLVTLFGISILVNQTHKQNAELPILVTLFGIVILVNPLQE